MAERAEGFIGRWSRRKLGGPEAAAPEPTAGAAGPEPPACPDSDPAPPVLTDEDMPPIESLGAESDFSCFLSTGVSEHLRQQALKKLFSLPLCQALDGLNDYDDDFTQLEPLGNTLTYQMKQWAEREARAQWAAADLDAPSAHEVSTPTQEPAAAHPARAPAGAPDTA